MWVNKLPEFQHPIWNKLLHGVTVEETEHNEHVCYFLGGIPINSFQIFGFLDDTGFRTTAPGCERGCIFLMIYNDHFTVVTLQVMVSMFKL